MPIYLKQSTASQEIPLGPFLDSSDGNTEEAGLTIANTDIKVWKSGATALVSKNSGGATYASNGVYYCVLDATDTNTLGTLTIHVHVSGALAVRVECVILAANIYDAMIGGSDNLQVDVTQWLGATVNALISGRVDASIGAVASGVIAAASFAAGALDSVWSAAARTLTAISDSAGVTTLLGRLSLSRAALLDNLNAAITSRMATFSYTAPDNVSIGEIKAKTVNLPADPADESALQAAIAAIPAGLSASDVRAALGLTAANLDTQLADLPTNTELAASQASADNATLAAIAALNNLSAAQVNAEVDSALADYDGPTNTEMVARTLVSTGYATAAALADLETHGDTDWATADISTLLASVDFTAALSDLEAHGDVEWTTATGFATPGDLPGEAPNAAAIQAAAASALLAYPAAKPSDIPNAAALQAASAAALTAYGALQAADLPVPLDAMATQAAANAALTAYGTAKTSQLPVAPLSAAATQALVTAALTAYQAAQKADVPDAALTYEQTLAALQAALTASGYSPERAVRIDHLDADISTVADDITFDSASVQAAVLLALAAYATAKTSDLPSAPLNAPPTQAVDQAAMAALGYDQVRAEKIDQLDQNVSSIIDGDIAVAINLETVQAALGLALAADDPLVALVPGTYPVGTAGWTLGQYGVIRDKALLITEETVNFVGVVQPMTGEFTLMRGDSYTVGSSRPLPEWSNADWSVFDLAHALSLTFKLRSGATGVVFSKALTLLSATQFRLELTSAETASFSAGRGNLYEVESILASGDIVTLAAGVVVVLKDIR